MRKRKNKTTTILSTFLSAIALFSVAGCMDKVEKVRYKHFVNAYSVARDFTVWSTTYPPELFIIGFRGADDYWVTDQSEGKDKELFEKLAAKNNDKSYNKTFECIVSPLVYRVFFSESIKNIQVTCDKDVDEKHPAGTPLNHLFLFFSGSPDTFINNGYKKLDINKDEYLKKMDKRFKDQLAGLLVSQEGEENTSIPIYGKIDEIDFLKYNLMGLNTGYGEMALVAWITPPENQLEYTLMIEIEFVDGVKKTAEVSMPKKDNKKVMC